MIEAGYRDFADRWNPIVDVFDECAVRFALEVHPSEIAYDFWTTERALEAIGRRPGFGINFDPSHMVWQGLDPAAFLTEFADRIYRVHVKGVAKNLDGRNGILSSHLGFGDRRRGWDFTSAGRDDVGWERVIRTLNAIGYTGPLSIEWEDAGMDRAHGAPEALEFVRKLDFPPADTRFDAAFSSDA
jgi:sugar phosphate isomerase/epimerase